MFNTRVHCTEIEIIYNIYIYIYIYSIASLNYISIIFQLYIKTLDKQKRNNLESFMELCHGEGRTRGKMTLYDIYIYIYTICILVAHNEHFDFFFLTLNVQDNNLTSMNFMEHDRTIED